MLGKMVPYGNIPFFWTRNFDLSTQLIGINHDYDDIYIDGSVKEGKFLLYYIKKNKVVAVAG